MDILALLVGILIIILALRVYFNLKNVEAKKQIPKIVILMIAVLGVIVIATALIKSL